MKSVVRGTRTKLTVEPVLGLSWFAHVPPILAQFIDVKSENVDNDIEQDWKGDEIYPSSRKLALRNLDFYELDDSHKGKMR